MTIDISKYTMRVTESHVYFWGGPPSQWFSSSFKGYLPEISMRDGRRTIQKSKEERLFSSAEKYMMMSKASLFGDMAGLDEMAKINDVKRLKALGRTVESFDQEVWDSANMIAVTIGSFYKMTGNSELFEFFEEMGDREYVEGSPHDKIWGVGIAWDDKKIENPLNWKGENRLGRCINNGRRMVVEFGRDADPFKAYALMKSKQAENSENGFLLR